MNTLSWKLAASPVVFNEPFIDSLAETICQIHHETVAGGVGLALDLSAEQEQAEVGRVVSVLYPVFSIVFGQSPAERYADLFEQVSDYASHMAKRHVFADGNKRTTVKVTLALLNMMSIDIRGVDSESPNDNMLYRWIQSVVTGDRDHVELAALLRDHAVMR